MYDLKLKIRIKLLEERSGTVTTPAGNTIYVLRPSRIFLFFERNTMENLGGSFSLTWIAKNVSLSVILRRAFP